MDSMSHLFVAAIDLGTTYSGIGFSSRDAFTREPTNVWLKSWHGTMVTYKSPTAILFDHQKFDSFGFEAEDKYTELLLDGEAEDWNYFTRFKMALYEQQVSFKLREKNHVTYCESLGQDRRLLLPRGHRVETTTAIIYIYISNIFPRNSHLYGK
jgi:hypothetical protein